VASAAAVDQLCAALPASLGIHGQGSEEFTDLGASNFSRNDGTSQIKTQSQTSNENEKNPLHDND
jgi:hypothetical protein